MSSFRYLQPELVEHFAAGNGIVVIGPEASSESGMTDVDAALRSLGESLDGLPAGATGPEIALYFEIEYGREELVRRLRDQFEHHETHSASILRHIAALNPAMIFTTTYDDQLEQALRAARRRYSVVARGPHALVRTTDRLPVIKLFGDFSQPAHMVVTARDRERFIVDRSPLNQLMELFLQTRTVLFVGYGAADPDLRAVLNLIHDSSERDWRNIVCLVAEAAPYPIRDLERRGVRVAQVAHTDRYDRQTVAAWLDDLSRAIRQRRAKSHLPSPVTTDNTPRSLFTQVNGLLETMGYSILDVRRDAQGIAFVAEKNHEGVQIRRRIKCVERSLGSADVDAMFELIANEPGTEGWLITYRRGAITGQAQTAVTNYPAIQAMSVAEFHRTMLNLDGYLRRLIASYEEDDVSRYWVDLACEVPQHDRYDSAQLRTDSFDSAVEFLDTWIDTPGRNHISILGDFGTGKTWLCHRYAATLARRYLVDCEHNRVPIVISLRGVQQASSLREMITDLLVNDYQLNLPGGYRTFEFLNRNDGLVLIFDGFDEMQVHVDARKAEENFEELAKVVLPDANCKVMLTCRTGYFRTDIEGRGMLAGEGIRRIRLRDRPNFEILHLRQLNEEQIRKVLQLRVPRDWEQYLGLIGRTYDLPDLSQRPILLSMITATLPRLLNLEHVTPADLYQAYTDEWIMKNITEQRTFVDGERKAYFMQELAWEMWQRETLSIHYSEFPRRVREHFGLGDDSSIDFFEHDIRTQTFLKRDSRGFYMFAHKSFMEFFIAQKIVGQVRADDSTLLSEVQTSHETDQFIKDFLIREPEHIETLTLWMREGGDALQRVNCAGILAKIGNPAITEGVISALRQDFETRRLYLTAVLFRVLEIQWEAASRLADYSEDDVMGRIARLPADQLPKVIDKFCVELHNPRDGVARWFSAVLLDRIQDVAPDKVAATFATARDDERIESVRTVLGNP